MAVVNRKIYHFITVAVLILASLLMVLSSTTIFKWGDFSRGSAVGPMNYTLNASFDPVGFQYELNTEPTGQGGLGSGLATNISVGPVKKTYPQVRGEFLDNIGILYNSYREKTYEYEILMEDPPEGRELDWEGNNPSAILNVTLHSDMIPWWREGSNQQVRIKVTYAENELAGQVNDDENANFSISINKIEVRARIYDEDRGEYLSRENDVVLFSTDESITFEEIGDSHSMKAEVSMPDGESQIGLSADISADLTDYWGREELTTLSGKANPINVYEVENGYYVRAMGIPLALPLMIIAVIFAMVYSIVGIFTRRSPIYLSIPGALFSILAPLWFFLGLRGAVDLLGQRLTGAEEGLSYGPGIYIAFAGAFLYAAALAISIVMWFLSKRKVEDLKFTEVSDSEEDAPREGEDHPPRFKPTPPQ